MVKNNGYIIPIENYKKTEEVREIDYKVPSYEEFMNSYENDGNFNYDDLNGWDIGVPKGYGPTGDREVSFKASPYKKGVFSIGDCGASGKARTVKGNLGGEYTEMEGEAGVSVFGIKDWSGDAKFLSASAGAEIGPSMDL